MKFLHTADWQLGMKANHVGSASERVRGARIEAVERLVSLAKDNGLDLILAAGDMFEDNGVDRLLILKVVQILSGAGCPVLIIPGNHDPIVPGSVWYHSAWARAANIHVLTEEKPVELESGIIYPCPIRDKFSTKDPTAWISAATSSKIRIGLAHGNVEGLPQGEPDHRISRDAAMRSNLDYLALGHWHSTAMYPAADGAVRMAYCGTPEPSCFGERDSGNVLLVEIERAGSSPQIRHLQTGKLRWEKKICEIKAKSDLDALRSEIEAEPEPSNVLLDLELTGVLHPDSFQGLRDLEDLASSRFLFGRLETSGLVPAPEDRAWIDDLPGGYVREAAERLQEISQSGGEDSSIAARALLDLFAIAKEVRR